MAKGEGVQLSVGFRCTDTGAAYGVVVRFVIAKVLASAPPNATVEMHKSEPTVRGLLSPRTRWPRPAEEGSATFSAETAEEAALFWRLFDPPVEGLPALARGFGVSPGRSGILSAQPVVIRPTESTLGKDSELSHRST